VTYIGKTLIWGVNLEDSNGNVKLDIRRLRKKRKEKIVC
jgi:hypothetical protein